MKILEQRTAPNPRRVRIFLAEKGIAVPYEQHDMARDQPANAFDHQLGAGRIGEIAEHDDQRAALELPGERRQRQGKIGLLRMIVEARSRGLQAVKLSRARDEGRHQLGPGGKTE